MTGIADGLFSQGHVVAQVMLAYLNALQYLAVYTHLLMVDDEFFPIAKYFPGLCLGSIGHFFQRHAAFKKTGQIYIFIAHRYLHLLGIAVEHNNYFGLPPFSGT